VGPCAVNVGERFEVVSDLNGKRLVKLILRIFGMTSVIKFFLVSRKKFLASLIFVTVATFAGCGTSRPSQTSLSKQKTEHVQQFYGLLLPDIHSISAGNLHTCAIDGDRVKCWGYNGYGQTDVPAGLKYPRSVSAGWNHTCVIDDEGVKCWGYNGYHQTDVPYGLKNPKSVSAGKVHTCAIHDEGVKCWGYNGYNQTDVPSGLKNPQSVSAGWDNTCVIEDEGVKCWGDSHNFGQTTVPAGLKKPYFLDAGVSHYCVIDDEGVKCWGNNENGQNDVPAGLKSPRYVSAGWQRTCAIDGEGVKCWGNNENGQNDVPAGLKSPRSVSAGWYHTCVLDEEGVKCWGNNENGETSIPETVLAVQNSNALVRWPQILSQFTNGDKHQFFTNIQNSIFLSLVQPAIIDSTEHQLLVHLMTRYISEFPSDYFRQDVSPKWRDSLKVIEKKTGIKTAADIPQSPEILAVAVKLLNAAFISVKPMLSSPEQLEVDNIVLKINASLSGEMTQAAARGVVKEIRKHQTLMAAIAASDAVHMTSVVVEDASHWIMKD
jgi:hypothetical protein